jgi:RNA polymerase sigma factor for flagellar operon FliA
VAASSTRGADRAAHRPEGPPSGAHAAASPHGAATSAAAAAAEATPRAHAPVAPPSDRRALLEQYAPYVRAIAGKIKKTVPKEIGFDELYDYGIIGLLEAADRYDPAHGANFMTYAYYRVRGAIYDGLRGMGWMSRTDYHRARFEERANAYLSEHAHAPQHDAEPSARGEQDGADEAGSGQADVHPLEHAVGDLAHAVHSLAAVYITSLDAAQEAALKDEAQVPAEDRLQLEEARALVRRTIRALPEQERRLLEMYYYKDMSMQRVGDELGLSKSWTSRLHARVIDKLHRMLEETGVGPG